MYRVGIIIVTKLLRIFTCRTYDALNNITILIKFSRTMHECTIYHIPGKNNRSIRE